MYIHVYTCIYMYTTCTYLCMYHGKVSNPGIPEPGREFPNRFRNFRVYSTEKPGFSTNPGNSGSEIPEFSRGFWKTRENPGKPGKPRKTPGNPELVFGCTCMHVHTRACTSTWTSTWTCITWGSHGHLKSRSATTSKFFLKTIWMLCYLFLEGLRHWEGFYYKIEEKKFFSTTTPHCQNPFRNLKGKFIKNVGLTKNEIISKWNI